MRISEWSSDVCSSDLRRAILRRAAFDALRDPVPEFVDGVAEEVATLFPLTQGIADHLAGGRLLAGLDTPSTAAARSARKRVAKGTRVSVRVDLSGRRIIKKKKSRYLFEKNSMT